MGGEAITIIEVIFFLPVPLLFFSARSRGRRHHYTNVVQLLTCVFCRRGIYPIDEVVRGDASQLFESRTQKNRRK